MTLKINLLLLLLTLLYGRPTPLSAQESTAAGPDLQEQLQSFRSAYQQDMLRGNTVDALAYFADNIRLMPEFQMTLLGKTSARHYYQAFGERFKVSTYRREAREVLDLEKRIIEIGSFRMTIASRTTGRVRNISGKYIDMWERMESGSYSLITQGWNYDHGLEKEWEFKFAELPRMNVAMQAHLPIDNSIRFELAALNKLMEMAITQHDAALWSRFYADEGEFLYSRHEPVRGRRALDGFFVKHVEELPIFEHLDVRTDRIDDLGAYVIEYASHIANIRNGDFSGVFTGKDLRIWQRQADCSLKIFRHIAMYD